MAEILNDVGKHDEWGKGHYEAAVRDDGTVTITTIFEGTSAGEQRPRVKLTRDEWYRLAAWVAWAEGEWKGKE